MKQSEKIEFKSTSLESPSAVYGMDSKGKRKDFRKTLSSGMDFQDPFQT